MRFGGSKENTSNKTKDGGGRNKQTRETFIHHAYLICVQENVPQCHQQDNTNKAKHQQEPFACLHKKAGG